MLQQVFLCEHCIFGLVAQIRCLKEFLHLLPVDALTLAQPELGRGRVARLGQTLQPPDPLLNRAALHVHIANNIGQTAVGVRSVGARHIADELLALH